MILPVVLFLLGLPQAGDANADNTKGPNGNSPVGGTGAKGADIGIGFDQLAQAGRNPDLHQELSGTTVRLIGHYKGDQSDRFTLVCFKDNDGHAEILKAVVMVDPDSGTYPIRPETYRNQCVQITGRLEFRKDLAKNDFIPVILLTPKKADDQDVVKIVPFEFNP